MILQLALLVVAPVRERGLKSSLLLPCDESHLRRSREGAWIEMIIARYLIFSSINVAPVRERGLKLHIDKIVLHSKRSRSREGAWIEMLVVSG